MHFDVKHIQFTCYDWLKTVALLYFSLPNICKDLNNVHSLPAIVPTTISK